MQELLKKTAPIRTATNGVQTRAVTHTIKKNQLHLFGSVESDQESGQILDLFHLRIKSNFNFLGRSRIGSPEGELVSYVTNNQF